MENYNYTHCPKCGCEDLDIQDELNMNEFLDIVFSKNSKYCTKCHDLDSDNRCSFFYKDLDTIYIENKPKVLRCKECKDHLFIYETE